MNTPRKLYTALLLLFSIFTTMPPICADYSHATVWLNLGHQSHSRAESRLHHDFSHENKRYNPGFDKPSVYKQHFSRYTINDFKQYFSACGYTENQILNQRCLYMFDEFVKFAQTYNGYKCTVQQLHVELKNIGWLQKAYHMAKGSYCPGLQKRMHFLYNELNSIKATQPDTIPFLDRNSAEYKQCIALMSRNSNTHSVSNFNKQLPEYAALDSTYRTHTPSLSNAIEKRVEAHTSMSSSNIQYATKAYNLNNNVTQLLHKYGHNTASFNECFGTQLDHVIHHESLDILERIDALSQNSILYDHQEALVDFAVAIVDYNHEGLTDKATHVADFCWTLLDYGQAVAEGAALGIYSAATDILTNPIEATVNIVAGRQVLAYQLSKVLYNVADIGLTAITDHNHAKEKWNRYTAPLNNIITAISNKEISLRDAVKSGTAFVMGWKAQSKLLGGLGKFCNTIKQKTVSFAQKNPLFSPQEYVTTPEGLLLKTTKLKQSGKTNTASNLKNGVENKAAKNNSLKNSAPATKPTLTGNTIANKGIIRNISRNLRSTIAEYQEHIFSKEHIQDGIMDLGKDQETIMDSLRDVITSIDKKGLLQEGSNQMRVMINKIDNVEIRCRIQNGEVISANAFISNFGRIFSNFIDMTKV